MVRFTYEKDATKIKAGAITILGDFNCGVNYTYLVATDPVIVSN